MAGDPSSPPEILDPSRERGIVVVVPHPDDETLAAGGTIARAADAGVAVTVLCGTSGQLGRRFGRPFLAHRESLPDLRRRELAQACRILGCRHRLLGLHDKTIEFEDEAAVARTVGAHLRELGPSLVVTFHPDAGAHPDHEALARSTLRAAGDLPDPPRTLGVAVGDSVAIVTRLGPPQVVCPVGGVVGRKNRALRAHASQTAEMFVPGDPNPRGPRTTRYAMGAEEPFYVLAPGAEQLAGDAAAASRGR